MSVQTGELAKVWADCQASVCLCTCWRLPRLTLCAELEHNQRASPREEVYTHVYICDFFQIWYQGSVSSPFWYLPGMLKPYTLFMEAS